MNLQAPTEHPLCSHHVRQQECRENQIWSRLPGGLQAARREPAGSSGMIYAHNLLKCSERPFMRISHISLTSQTWRPIPGKTTVQVARLGGGGGTSASYGPLPGPVPFHILLEGDRHEAFACAEFLREEGEQARTEPGRLREVEERVHSEGARGWRKQMRVLWKLLGGVSWKRK